MTINQMFKKVNGYNEIAELTGAPKAKLYFTEGVYWSETFTDFNTFRHYIDSEYIEELAKPILRRDDWEFNKELSITWVSRYGDTFTTRCIMEVIS